MFRAITGFISSRRNAAAAATVPRVLIPALALRNCNAPRAVDYAFAKLCGTIFFCKAISRVRYTAASFKRIARARVATDDKKHESGYIEFNSLPREKELESRFGVASQTKGLSRSCAGCCAFLRKPRDISISSEIVSHYTTG